MRANKTTNRHHKHVKKKNFIFRVIDIIVTIIVCGNPKGKSQTAINKIK